MRPRLGGRAALCSPMSFREERRQRGGAELRCREGYESLADPGVELRVELLDLGDLEILPPAANQGVQPGRERLIWLAAPCVDDALHIGLKACYGFGGGEQTAASEMEA